MRKLLLTAPLAVVSTSASASPGMVYYIDLINMAASSIFTFEAAPAGGQHFHSILHGNAALQGGASATVALRTTGHVACTTCALAWRTAA